MVLRASKICVLNSYRIFHHLLTALNSENFQHSYWGHNIRSIFHAISSTLLISLLQLILTILVFWYLVENESDFKSVMVSLPLLLSSVQMQVAFVSLIISNRNISKAIDQVQKVVNQRRFSTLNAFKMRTIDLFWSYQDAWYQSNHMRFTRKLRTAIQYLPAVCLTSCFR